MAGKVHGGSLGRLFEELCRIKHDQLREIVASNLQQLAPRSLPTTGGVYAFWWTGRDSLLRSSSCNRSLELTGPGKRPVMLEIDDEWLGIEPGLPIPLYVGKTATGMNKRIGQHLRLKARRMLPILSGAKKPRLPTTSCQLRGGIERLFPREEDSRSMMLDNVGLSYVILDGDEHAANRFYLEDLAIGLMRPPLNVDIER